MGILRKPDLNNIQRWALARYLYDQREMRREEIQNYVDEINFYANLPMFKAIHFPESDSPVDEVSEEVSVDELAELDKWLSSAGEQKSTQEVFFGGDWI